MTIVPLNPADLDALLEIEERSFPTPNSRASYLAELANPDAVLLGAKDPDTDTLLGYINFWIVCGDCHLHTLAVAPAARRRQVGDRLVQAMVEQAQTANARVAYLEVRPSNHAALALYRERAFEEIGRRPGYYPGDREDAILMQRIIPPRHP